MQTEAPSRRLSLPQYIASAAIIAGATALFLETAMIVFEPYVFTGIFQYDADLGFQVRPYAAGSNRFGFNERDYPLAKSDQTYRVLILGDSHNWAGGRDRNYTVHVQNRFDRAYGTDRVEIINAGYPMTSTAEQLDVLKEYGLQYDPDFVLLAFSMSDDFIDADPYRQRIVLNDSYFDVDRRYLVTVLGYPMVPQSRLFTFISQQFRGAWESWVPTFLAMPDARLQFFSIENQENDVFGAEIDVVLGAISRMKQLLLARQIRGAVSVLPDELQMGGELFDHVVRRGKYDPAGFDLTLANTILTRHLDLEQVDYVDLLPAFRQEHEKQRLYEPLDWHWTDAGNNLAADVTFEFLQDQVSEQVTVTGLSRP